MKPVSAVANEFLDLAERSNQPISNIQLIKMLYIAQGLSLALLDKEIFDDDRIEAWKYGPVIPSIYHEFKHFTDKPIAAKSIQLRNDETGTEPEAPVLKDKREKQVVRLTWQLYADVSPEELIRVTHKSGTPWDIVYEPKMNNIIPNHLIRLYYKDYVKNMKSLLHLN